MMKRIHPLTKRTYAYVRAQSNASPSLGNLQRLFYKDGTKEIPEELSKLMKSEISFAIWFYDDGYYYARDKSLYLYLGTVPRRSAEIAQATLKKNFDLLSTILDKKKKGFALYFPTSERGKIQRILKRYYVPVMAYKIPS